MLRRTAILILSVLASVASGVAAAAEPIRVALIETQSTPAAVVGKWWGNHIRYAIDRLNAQGGLLGRPVEVLTFDTKSSPQETLIAFKAAVDQDLHFVFGTTGSHVALALNDAVAKHNARNPAQAVLFFNYGGVTPEMTNERCNFWHFRFDAHSDMKTTALIQQVAREKGIGRIYLMNQDYAYGQAVRKLQHELLARKRPDIQVVGDDLVQLQKTKDFAPYVAKIRASGADAVLTSNWGPDLVLLMRAAHDAGLVIRFFTLNGHFAGTPSAIGEAGVGRLVNVSSWHHNLADGRVDDYYAGFKRQYKDEWNSIAQKYAVDMWARAVEKTRSLDPVAVARTLENMRYDGGAGPVWMRPDDHQLMMPQFVYALAKVGEPGVRHELEGMGLGWRSVGRIEAQDGTLPHTCHMQRP